MGTTQLYLSEFEEGLREKNGLPTIVVLKKTRRRKFPGTGRTESYTTWDLHENRHNRRNISDLIRTQNEIFQQKDLIDRGEKRATHDIIGNFLISQLGYILHPTPISENFRGKFILAQRIPEEKLGRY